MLQAKSIIQKKIINSPYLFTNIVFGFFPISLILGSLIVNLNLVLFCCLGIYLLKTKILTTRFDFPIKIIFLFFLLIFFSTILSFVKTIYFEGYDSSIMMRLSKSILFFRFFLLLLVIYLLNKFNILNFNLFFMIGAFSATLISLDIIYQYFFGFDIIGLKSSGFYNSGFFGDEKIAGGYILKFAFFAIFSTIFIFKNKNCTKTFSVVFVICILGVGIFFAGNRMPLILFIFGLCLLFLFNFKIKKILLISFLSLFIIFKLIVSSNELYKAHIYNAYKSYYLSAKSIITLGSEKKINLHKKKNIEQDELLKSKTDFFKVRFDGLQKRVFLAAIETWKVNKIFGNGIKSFRGDCWELEKRPDTYMGEDFHPSKKNLLCSTHPHNYYFEILTETGIVGLAVTLLIASLFIVFIYKNFKMTKQIRVENIILLSAIISLILETIPLRSTGSLFTTNNATYLILISSIVLSYKKLMKISNSDEKVF